MEKKINKLRKKIEKKRMLFEKRCMFWLLETMHDVREMVDGLSSEEYMSPAGQTLERIANDLEFAESYSMDMITCMLNAETEKFCVGC